MRFAVIGSNFIVERFLTAAKLCQDFQLTTFYSRSMGKAETLAKEWGAGYAVDSIAALAGSNDVDAVYVASPNICHAPQSIELLTAGKHVLCEKPIARDSRQLAQMLEAAKTGGALLLEAIRTNHIPTTGLIAENMQRLGRLRQASFSYCQYSSRYDSFKAGKVANAFDPTLCNGALMDIGVYCVHMMTVLFGTPKRLYAMGSFLPRSIDACGSVLCEYDGMQVSLTYSKVTRSSAPSYITGEAGTLFFTPTATPYDLWIEWNDGSREIIPTGHVCRQDMVYELRDFIAMARGEESPRRYHDYSKKTMAAMDEIRRQIGIDFTLN